MLLDLLTFLLDLMILFYWGEKTQQISQNTILFSVVVWDASCSDTNKNVVMDITFAQPVVAVRIKKDR